MKKMLSKLAFVSSRQVVSFFKNRQGVAMTEFAMMLPLLMMIAAGSFEVARYALIVQKLDRIVATLSDLVARSGSENMTELQVANILDSAYYMARPFDITGESMMILTSVEGRSNRAPEILSQRVEGDVTGKESTLGTTINGDATLPSAFPDAGGGETLADGETLIVAELYYNYEPYLLSDLGFFGDSIFYRTAYFRPRFTDRITFPAAP